MESIEELLRLQSGVISRRQLVARGVTDSGIARKVRRRELCRLHPGVYVDHTGTPTWAQRAWGAVLFSWPAALSHGSALRAADGPGRIDDDDAVIHVVVEHARHLVAPPGVVLHRSAGVAERIQWNRSPPRVRYEEAAIDAAAEARTDLAAVGLLARVVQSRRTTARRLQQSATARSRLPRRSFLVAVLGDVAEGACSVLEREYLVRVERGHGLPRAQRQLMSAGRTGRVYRDASYDVLLVELDGQLLHDTAEGRDHDFDRDLLALVGGQITARLSYGQVLDRPCWTAAQVARLLQERGWAGRARRCGPSCRLLG